MREEMVRWDQSNLATATVQLSPKLNCRIGYYFTSLFAGWAVWLIRRGSVGIVAVHNARKRIAKIWSE